MVANPLTPHVVEVTGTNNSSEGDPVVVTVFSGDTARGSVKTALGSDNTLTIDLANSNIAVEVGDTIVVSHGGSALGATSVTSTGGGATVSVSATTVAFPSRVL